jgi:hypothetical protein
MRRTSKRRGGTAGGKSMKRNKSRNEAKGKGKIMLMRRKGRGSLDKEITRE